MLTSSFFSLTPMPSGGRWHPPLPREADDGRGRILPLADSIFCSQIPTVAVIYRRGPVTFSLSGRPCGRHPPPLGEGTGEGALDDIKCPAHPQRAPAGCADPGAPGSSTNDMLPPPANPQYFPVGDGVLDVPQHGLPMRKHSGESAYALTGVLRIRSR